MPPTAPYSYLTWIQLRQALALRLNDVGNVCWTDGELKVLLGESLRSWNAITQWYVVEWTETFGSTDKEWQSLANSANSLVGANSSSPRYQTLSDVDLYTLIEYHLLEPPTGATWTGTNQFSLNDLTQSFKRRRDQILQLTAANVGLFSPSLSIVPGTNRVQLPDSTSLGILDIRRVRYLPASGDPITLFRDDTLAMEYFSPDFPQESGDPMAWGILGSPPQAITFDTLANQPNSLDILAILGGSTVSSPSPLLIPDDWAWVMKWGMISDLLSKEAESNDRMRASYAEQRFQEGIRLMMELPWLMQARIDNVPCDSPAVEEMDQYDLGWESRSDAQMGIVRGGIDLFAVSPKPSGNVSVSLSLVGSAPVPVADGDYVQLPRENINAILDEAEHLAQFRHGGQEFLHSIPLHQNFIQAAMDSNRRVRESGIFATTLRPPVSRQSEVDPRYALKEQS